MPVGRSLTSFSGCKMRYQGKVSDPVELDGFNISQVKEAIVTPTQIQIDWDEGGDIGHLRATSTDGISYSGTYGYRRLDPALTLSLKRYDAKDGSILLVGSWNNANEDDGATWIFRLSEMSDPPKTKTKKR